MGSNLIQAQLDLSRPIGEAFDYVADFRNENEWNVVAHDVRMLTEPPIGKGSRFLGEYDRVGTLEYEILEYDRPRHLLVRATSKWFDSVSTFDLAARDEVTHVIFAIDPKPKGFFKLLGPLMTGMAKGQMEKSMRALKRSLEGASGPLVLLRSPGKHHSLRREGGILATAYLTRQPQPPALILNEPSCYHIRVLDHPPGYTTPWM